MSSIILYANKKIDGSYDKSKYWKVSDDDSAALAENSLYAGVTTGGHNRRTRLTFFPKSSTFNNQTITSVKLNLTVKSLYSSATSTLDTNIKISSTNADTNAAYIAATGNGVLSAKVVGKQFTFIFSKAEVENINTWCKNGNPFSIYLGIDSSNGKNGVQYYGYKSDYKPTLEIEYQPSISTGSISNNPKIGSSFRVTINKVSGTDYTHKIIISSSASNATLTSTLNKDITYQNFTISAADTSKWINSSTSQRTNCLIETYSNGTKIGDYSFDFILSVADILDVTWDDDNCSITATSNINGYNYLISGKNYPIIKVKATAIGSTIDRYRLEINSCGVVLNKIYDATSSGSLNVTLEDKAPYTSSNAYFIVNAYAINSLGIESASKEIKKLCYAYALPSTILNPIRALNSSGTEDINGTYIYNKSALNYISLNGNNKITDVTVKIGNSYPDSVTWKDEPDLTFHKSGANTEIEYDVTVTITDRVATNTIQAKIPSSNFLIHIKKGGKAIGIGSASTKDENTINLGWKLLVKKGIEFYNAKGEIVPLPTASGGTGVSSYKGLKEQLEKNGLLNYLPSDGGALSGNLSINGALSTTNSNKAITLKGSNFTYNENKVAVINDNIRIENRAPNDTDTGLIWFAYT